MRIVEENTRRKLWYMLRDVEITELINIGDLDTLVILTDGRKIIYDELYDRLIHIPISDGNDISEERWRKEFSRKIKKKMAIRAVTQKDLSKLLDMSQQSISNYINGRTIPNIFVIRRLANYFKCSVSDLTDFDYLL